jgi:ABC transporter substrate binding protein
MRSGLESGHCGLARRTAPCVIIFFAPTDPTGGSSEAHLRRPRSSSDVSEDRFPQLGRASVLAARAATTTIPIVFYTGGDPVQLGLVTSLSRPGGNLTGVVTLNVELAAKRLQLLHELVPAANIIALLVNPTDSNVETTLKSLRAAARDLGLQVHVLRASTEPP